MTNLYNMLFGTNPAAPYLMGAIDLDVADVPRFRDAWVNRDLTEVTVFARLGGGNRHDYEDAYAKLQAHPLWLEVVNNEVDETYAEFTFSLPPEAGAKLREVIYAGDPTPENIEANWVILTETASEKFSRTLSALKDA